MQASTHHRNWAGNKPFPLHSWTAGELAKMPTYCGLQWYRSRTEGRFDSELQLFSGLTIEVPALFIAGKSDWGTYQRPGNFERMQQSACRRMLGCHLIDGAGHWVQQEQPGQVSRLLIGFLQR